MSKNSSSSNSVSSSKNLKISTQSKPASTKRPYPIFGRRPITRSPPDSCKEILKKKPNTLECASISIPDSHSESSCSCLSSCSSSSSSSTPSVTSNYPIPSTDEPIVYVLCKIVDGVLYRV
ncbi:hypothetical protein RND81_04G025000 [Saponaria officinalis]|uniref:Uncharacterized protein n=1 Tax=Saponaria officinalis TaxID=3572 RepID=A0AAW1LHQ5_SAPOF